MVDIINKERKKEDKLLSNYNQGINCINKKTSSFGALLTDK